MKDINLAMQHQLESGLTLTCTFSLFSLIMKIKADLNSENMHIQFTVIVLKQVLLFSSDPGNM